MGRARIFIVLAIAAVGAIGLALIVGAMTKHKPPPPPQVVAVQPSAPMARVLVARRDLDVGTPLTSNDMTWQDWPVAAVNPAFITDGRGAHAAPAGVTSAIAEQAGQTVRAAATAVAGGANPMDQLSGSIVREAILANEPITNAKLVRGGQGGYMAVVLHPGMRAVAVPVTASDTAGGFILPGDRVDVVQAHPADASSGRGGYAASVLLRNVRVLAIDQNSQPPKNGQRSQIGGTATIEVAADDTEVIARAKLQGQILLALRPYSDVGGPSGPPPDQGSSGQVRIFRSGQAPETVTLQ
jgi:pilus assembly protein CpaB